MVTMYSKYTAHISSNGSHFLTARVLVYWTYKVSKFWYGRTKWMASIYSKYTAHISWNGSHFLMARVLVYWTYRVRKFGYGRTKWMINIYTAHIRSNGSHFWRLGSWCTEHIRSVHDMHQVTTGYLFRVTISTAHISSNGSHFFQLVSWTIQGQ